jgi:hypothetical protein
VLGWAVLAVLLAAAYFRRYEISRPPIGVFNGRDVYVVLVGITLVPYLYLALPLWTVTGLLALAHRSPSFTSYWSRSCAFGWPPGQSRLPRLA